MLTAAAAVDSYLFFSTKETAVLNWILHPTCARTLPPPVYNYIAACYGCPRDLFGDSTDGRRRFAMCRADKKTRRSVRCAHARQFALVLLFTAFFSSSFLSVHYSNLTISAIYYPFYLLLSLLFYFVTSGKVVSAELAVRTRRSEDAFYDFAHFKTVYAILTVPRNIFHLLSLSLIFFKLKVLSDLNLWCL